MLTPINIARNWLINQDGLKDTPKNTGIQWMRPAMMANTAPIDNT
jgi:hypothetical protein